jgi:hypothetical protein
MGSTVDDVFSLDKLENENTHLGLSVIWIGLQKTPCVRTVGDQKNGTGTVELSAAAVAPILEVG